MTVVDRYQNRVYDMYMKTHPNVNPEKVKTLIHQFTLERCRDIPCVLHNNVTHELVETSMINTMDWIEQRKPITCGNGTFFKQHAECLSPTIIMLEQLQKKRKQIKKAMFACKKGTPEYNNKNVGQLNVKVIMNADYGGSGTPDSPFYSVYIPPATTSTAKNITTTLICCLEFLSGNMDKWAKLNNINELYDLIFIVLEDPDNDKELIVDKFSVEEVATWLLSRVNEPTLSDVLVLKTYLGTLTDRELSKLMLAFNIRLVLTKYCSVEIGQIMSYLKKHPVDFDNISEESLQEAGYGVQQPEVIGDLINHVSKIVLDNCVYNFIPNDPEVRANEMKRMIVCVTDTDSLMLHFAHYLDEFQAHVPNFRDSCIIASAFGMRLFIEHIIPKFVSGIAENMGIQDKYYRDKFVFKNEFAFLSMALFAKKMYATSMFVQEGKPRDPHAIAVTGLSFKKRDAAEFLEPIMDRLYDQYILTADRINVSGILDEFYALRNQLKAGIKDNPKYFKVLTIKSIGAYDKSKALPAQMRGAIVWNAIMPDEEMLPMDRVIVIPLSFKLLHQYEASDPRTAKILELCLIDNANEKKDPYICIPEHYHTIPDWIKCVIDVDYAIDKLLTPFKQLLGLFDVNMCDTRGGMVPSRMMCL